MADRQQARLWCECNKTQQ